MITNTFRHVAGISAKRELELWRSGVVDWEQYESRFDQQLSLFSQSKRTFDLSREKHLQRDANYFSGLLPVTEHYRIALAYPHDALFIDIETTGTGFRYDQITVVGWSKGESYGIFIAGEDPQPMISAIESSKVIVTFNGIGFDAPIIRKSFPVHFPAGHLDLMLLGRKLGLRGGQKKLEKQLGLVRSDEVDGMTGRDAPILWNQYQRGDEHALNTLIKYNLADVYGMKVIFDALIGKMILSGMIPIKNAYPFARDKFGYSEVKG